MQEETLSIVKNQFKCIIKITVNKLNKKGRQAKIHSYQPGKMSKTKQKTVQSQVKQTK